MATCEPQVVSAYREGESISVRSDRSADKGKNRILGGVEAFEAIFLAANRLARHNVRISTDFARGLVRAVAVDDQSQRRAFFIHAVVQRHNALRFGIEEVDLDTRNAERSVFLEQGVHVALVYAVDLVNPNDKLYALIVRIFDKLGKPVVGAALNFIGAAVARLPAVVESVIAPAHFGGVIDVFFVGRKIYLSASALGEP